MNPTEWKQIKSFIEEADSILQSDQVKDAYECDSDTLDRLEELGEQATNLFKVMGDIALTNFLNREQELNKET